MIDLTELNKLEQYLKSKGIPYERIDRKLTQRVLGEEIDWSRHQICVPVEDQERREWDAICQRGSYGYEEGLIEIMGSIVSENDGDSVAGYLTADDVIKRIEDLNRAKS